MHFLIFFQSRARKEAGLPYQSRARQDAVGNRPKVPNRMKHRLTLMERLPSSLRPLRLCVSPFGLFLRER